MYHIDASYAIQLVLTFSRTTCKSQGGGVVGTVQNCSDSQNFTISSLSNFGRNFVIVPFLVLLAEKEAAMWYLQGHIPYVNPHVCTLPSQLVAARCQLYEATGIHFVALQPQENKPKQLRIGYLHPSVYAVTT